MPSAAASLCSDSGRSSPVPLGPPTIATCSRSSELRHPLEQRRDGPQQQVGRLERLDAPDEQQQHGVRRHPEPGPRRRRVGHPEQLQIDARRDRDDLVGAGAVEAAQLVGLVRGGGDQPVGLGRDPVLADQPGQRLRTVTVGQRGVLDLGQGVRGVHQRHRPARPRHPADLAGEPVVRVHQVVPAGLLGGLDPQHLGGERAQLGRQVGLVQSRRTARRPRAGPARPGSSSTTGGSVLEVARVNTSTSTPISASRRDTSST